MRPLLSALLVLLVALPVTAASAAAAGPARLADLPADVVALAAAPDGGVLALTRDRRLLWVARDGGSRVLPLPPVAGMAADEEFCDLATTADGVVLCRERSLQLYRLAFARPTRWQVLTPHEVPAGVGRWVALAAAGDQLWAAAAGAGLVAIARDGRCRALAADAVPVAGPDRLPLRLHHELTPQDARHTWIVMTSKGHSLFAAATPDLAHNLVGVEPLGCDGTGRLWLLTTTRDRDRSDRRALVAVAGGAEVRRHEMSTGGTPLCQRQHLLLRDDRLAFLVAGKEGERPQLMLVTP